MKKISIMVIVVLIMQIALPILTNITDNRFRLISIAANESWDVSENGDGSVIATVDEEGTMTISGTGNSKGNLAYYCPYNDVIEKIKKVIIEEGVTSIGFNAFRNFENLINIEIPSSISLIYANAFTCCNSLNNINVSKYNERYCSIDGVLLNKEKTKLIRYPQQKENTNYEILDSVKEISFDAFKDCINLTNVDIPEGVTTLGNSTFEGCINLTSISIPSSIYSMSSYTFYDCFGLTSINVSEDNEKYCSVDGVLFNKEKTRLIKYPANKANINYRVPESVIYIVKSSFTSCNNLKSIEIPEGITYIENNAFEYCENLTSIEIPSSVISIESFAFYGCSRLISINIPQNVTSIEASTFNGCSSIINIVIPEGVTSIEPRAFYECSNLETIYIPKTITSMGEKVFSKCDKLTLDCFDNSYAQTYAEENNISYIGKLFLSPKTIARDLIEQFSTNTTEIEIYNKDNEEITAENKIGTKAKMYIKDGNIEKTLTLIVTGDIDGDGESGFMDMLEINKYRLGLKELDDIEALAGDVNGDNTVNFWDLVLINQYRLGIESSI